MILLYLVESYFSERVDVGWRDVAPSSRFSSCLSSLSTSAVCAPTSTAVREFFYFFPLGRELRNKLALLFYFILFENKYVAPWSPEVFVHLLRSGASANARDEQRPWKGLHERPCACTECWQSDDGRDGCLIALSLSCIRTHSHVDETL